MVRHCKDVRQGAGSTSLGTLISGGASFAPPAPVSPAPRVPYLVPTLPPVPRQALQEKGGGGQRVARPGVQLGRGVFTAGPRSPSGPGRPSSPCEKKGIREEGLGWGHPQRHPTLGTGVELAPCPLRPGAVGFPVPGGGDTGGCSEDVGGLWRYLPVALGLRARLWLLAARPPGHPARGRQELVPVLAAHCSSQPCPAPPPPCQGSPCRPSTVLGAQHRIGFHVPPSRVVSASPRSGCSKDTPWEECPHISHAIGLPPSYLVTLQASGPLYALKEKREVSEPQEEGSARHPAKHP